MMSVSGLIERGPLADAEAVLLVHHHDREVVELYALLYERVGPNHDIRLPALYGIERRAALCGAQRAGEERDVHREVCQRARYREEVLFGEDLSWSHDGALSPGLDGGEQRGHGDDRLAAAHVALQEAAHRLIRAHVGEDFPYHPLLRGREPERQFLEKGVHQASVSMVSGAYFGRLEARFSGGESGLDQEELVEDQTPLCGRKACPVGREVDLVDGVVQIREVVPEQDLGWQRVEDVARRVEGAVDERPHPPGLYALVDGVYGHEPAGVRAVFPVRVVLDHLYALRDDLNPVAPLNLSRDDDPGIGQQLVQEPAPAPDRRRQVPGAVVELGGEAWGAPAYRPAHRTGAHDAGDHTRLLANAQIGDLLDVREVLVARGIVGDHVRNRGYA
jgi:hypothetical protein